MGGSVGVLSRSFVAMQFKLGIYQARQITRIERGGLVISCSDSRYQPDVGIRHELSPDEWFIYLWRFFPRYSGQYFCDEESLLRECYYDYFAKTGALRQSKIYSIFKDKLDTGYIIIQSFDEYQKSSYHGIYINQWGTSDYKAVFKNDRFNKISYDENLVYVESLLEAAAYMLADKGNFREVKIDLVSLQSESCALHVMLTKLLQKCNHADLYLEKLVAP